MTANVAGSDRSQNLRARQARAVNALLGSTTHEQAALSAGVSVRTLRRWRAEPAFAALVRAEARETAAAGRAQLMAAMPAAVSTLRAGLTGGTASTRVRAARAIVELGLRIVAGDVEERLTALEDGSSGGDTEWRNGSMSRFSVD